jgi:alpha-1,3-mannosyltransferase
MMRKKKPNQKLRVVHVVRQFTPAIGGLENFVDQLSRRQVAAGYEVRVVSLNRIFADCENRILPAREDYGGVDVHRVPFRGSSRYPIAPKVLPLVKNFDLIHVHGVDFFCDYLALTNRLHKTPMILTTHGGFFHTKFAEKLKRFYFDHITKKTLGCYAGVVACSESDAIEFNSIANGKVVVIENPVDIEKFDGLASRDCKQIVYFGRFSTNKRLERLLEWFGELYRADPTWRLVLAGREMDVSRDQLLNIIVDLELADCVQIHVSPTDEQLRALIASSGVYCSPSAYEGFGLAAIEAASAGLFPVLSNIPPHRRHIEKLNFGLLVDFEDASERQRSIPFFQEALACFKREVSPAQVNLAVQPFGWEGAVEKFELAYNGAIGA